MRTECDQESNGDACACEIIQSSGGRVAGAKAQEIIERFRLDICEMTTTFKRMQKTKSQ